MSRAEVTPRIRVLSDGDIALGPGKAELLGAIARTGSLAEAARGLGMSYMRAWKLVRTMNACFRRPLVESVRGGAERGGARLTRDGERALALYLAMEEAARKAMARPAAALRRLLR